MISFASTEELRCRISDEDIVECYLRPKVMGEATAMPRFIVEVGEELYTREPWLLPQQTDPILNPREWFYLGPKWVRPFQGVYFDGSWDAIEGFFVILSKETGEKIGVTRRYRLYCRNKNDDKGLMLPSEWFMREYLLYHPKFHSHALCKVTYNRPRPRRSM
ncbi:hypothetical protein EUTSA_v10014889mg [Eutrema salsugineum]|uniref:NAC domain-containing protein n=1 Tax=Eutrema salsugineum TaxID=72664 RepID=V4LEH1_EUTSA|nr:NAC domain-containing protein 5 [Eutrema salsugineum]ESQ42084.1 hypothetical protein EUTSA_v10014889mg [Eutrema salsugineum]